METRNFNPTRIYIYVFIGGILLFVLYGIFNVQFTMRLSPSYFAMFYPDIFDISHITESAVIWGIRAMWWIGVLVGSAQVVILRFGSANKFPSIGLKWLVQESFMLATLTFCICIITALIGYVLAVTRIISVSYWFPGIPLDMEARFLAVVVWHGTLYVCCLLHCLIISEVVYGLGNRGRRWL